MALPMRPVASISRPRRSLEPEGFQLYDFRAAARCASFSDGVGEEPAGQSTCGSLQDGDRISADYCMGRVSPAT